MKVIDDVVQYYNGEFGGYNWLAGENQDPFKDAIGKRIHSVRLESDTLVIRMEDDTVLRLSDDGQNCCEYRYMSLDGDDPVFADGAVLLGGGFKDHIYSDAKYDTHEIQFLEIITSHGSITLSAHNEHNGYYGGFSIRCTKG